MWQDTWTSQWLSAGHHISRPTLTTLCRHCIPSSSVHLSASHGLVTEFLLCHCESSLLGLSPLILDLQRNENPCSSFTCLFLVVILCVSLSAPSLLSLFSWGKYLYQISGYPVVRRSLGWGQHTVLPLLLRNLLGRDIMGRPDVWGLISGRN